MNRRQALATIGAVVTGALLPEIAAAKPRKPKKPKRELRKFARLNVKKTAQSGYCTWDVCALRDFKKGDICFALDMEKNIDNRYFRVDSAPYYDDAFDCYIVTISTLSDEEMLVAADNATMWLKGETYYYVAMQLEVDKPRAHVVLS